MSFLQRPFAELWSHRVSLFWPMWIALTAASVILTGWVVGHAAARVTFLESKGDTNARNWFSPRPPQKSLFALMLLGIFLIVYVAMSLVWEDFTYFDNTYFTLNTLRDHNIWMHIYPEAGRFFPLGLQEFNLIRHFASSFVGYQVFRILQLLVVCFCLLHLDGELTVPARAGIAVFALISPAIVISFGGLIYPEWNVIFWLLLLTMCVKQFEQTEAIIWGVSAVVCAQFMLYYKETAFLFLGGFTAGRLILRCKDSEGGTWKFRVLKDRVSRLDWCLTCLAIVFLIMFAAYMYPHHGTEYRDSIASPWSVVTRAYLKLDPLVWLFGGFFLWRIYSIVVREEPALPFWDGLALGGLACMSSYLYLRMYSAYYMAPVDLIAVLYVGRFAVLNWRNSNVARRWIFACSFGLVLFLNVSASAYHFYERKNLVHGRAVIAHVIQERYGSSRGAQRRLFFPFTTSTLNLIGFAAYLDYLGVAVEGAPDVPAGEGAVVMIVKGAPPNGKCATYIGFVCRPAAEPQRDDLLIVLPDDYVNESDWTPYEGRGETILSYQPYPRIPSLVYRYFRKIHPTSRIIPFSRLPDRWLQGTVQVYK